MTQLKDSSHPIRSGLVKGLKKLQSRNATLLEDLQNDY